MSFLVETRCGAPVVLSERLLAAGIPHAFGTRLGGHSVGRFAESNRSFFNGDDPAHVAANWGQMLTGAGLAGAALHVVKQVHGTDVVAVSAAAEGEAPYHHQGPGDGLTTTTPGAALGVLTADCVPVLMVFPAAGGRPRRVAAIHSGWRGTIAGIVPGFLRTIGDPPEVVALGPHIRGDRFEVGPELRADFAGAFLAADVDPVEGIRAGEGDRLLVDLELLLVGQLRTYGVPPAALETGAPCTYAREDLFFSYRRDGPGRGLLGHVVGLPREEPGKAA